MFTRSRTYASYDLCLSLFIDDPYTGINEISHYGNSHMPLGSTTSDHFQATAYLVNKWHALRKIFWIIIIIVYCFTIHGFQVIGANALIGILIKDGLRRIIHEVSLAWDEVTRANL